MGNRHETEGWAGLLPPVLRQLGADSAELHLWNENTEQPALAFQWKAEKKRQGLALSRLEPERAYGTPVHSPSKPRGPTLSIPLQGRDGPLGHLALTFPGSSSRLRPHQRHLAHQIAHALEDSLSRTRLWKSLLTAEKELDSIKRALVEAEEAERQRLGQDLHDSLVQTLVSTYQHLQLLHLIFTTDNTRARALLIRSTALTKQAINEAREIVERMYPTVLARHGLEAALTQELQPLLEDWGWTVEFHRDSLPELDTELQLSLFRIAREAIANAKKHSGTNRLRVTIDCSTGEAILEVQDWGKGFDPEKALASPRRASLGIPGMLRRAGLLGGHCEISSSPGEGTLVKARLPILHRRSEPCQQ